MVPETLDLLRGAGFIDRGATLTTSMNAGALIGAWVAAYPTGLMHKITVGRYRGCVQTGDELGQRGSVLVPAGEAAISHIRNPERGKYFADDWSVRTAAPLGWGRADQPNITVRRKYWAAEEDGAAARFVLPIVHYAELIADGDSRLRGEAMEFRRENPELRAS